jgi:hypothetical protein
MKYSISNNDPQLLSRQPAMHEQMLSRQLKDLGSKGGKARAQTLTIKQRKDIASKAANARWAQEKDK